MSECIPVSANACREIKALAKRFSNRLHLLTRQRIRGQQLYGAFSKPLGYDTFNQLQHQTARSADAAFDMDGYLNVLKRQLRKHLPVVLDGALLSMIIDDVADPGSIFLKIDGSKTDSATTKQLVDHPVYRAFVKEYKDRYGEQAALLELVAPDSQATIPEPPLSFAVTLDFSGWKNEGNPFRELASYRPFLRLMVDLMATGNGHQVKVLRVNQAFHHESLAGIEPNGKEQWQFVYVDERSIPRSSLGISTVFARSVPFKACIECDEDIYDNCSRSKPECSTSSEADSVIANTNARFNIQLSDPAEKVAQQIAKLIPSDDTNNDSLRQLRQRVADLLEALLEQEDDLAFLQNAGGISEGVLEQLSKLDRKQRNLLWRAYAVSYRDK